MQFVSYDLLADGFQLLAMGLKCPETEIASALSSGALVEDLASVYSEVDPEGWRSASGSFDALRSDARATPHEILSYVRKDYTRLFSSPKAELVPIYESVFRANGEPNTDFGMVVAISPEARDSLRCYKSAGLTLAIGESPDHASIQCEFLGFLCREMACEPLTQKWRIDFEYFVAHHMEGWLPEFFDKVRSCANTSYYQLIACLGMSICKMVLK